MASSSLRPAPLHVEQDGLLLEELDDGVDHPGTVRQRGYGRKASSPAITLRASSAVSAISTEQDSIRFMGRPIRPIPVLTSHKAGRSP